MRRLSLLFFVLCLAPSVHAALFISVNGVVEPPFAEILLEPGETAILGIHGDGLTAGPIEFYLFVEGPGSIDGYNYNMVYPGSLSGYEDLEDIADSLGMSPENALAVLRDETGNSNLEDIGIIWLVDMAIPPAPLEGVLVDDIIFHCNRVGDVNLTMWACAYIPVIYDTKVIHQIAEPMTLLLLGMGTFLMRRKRSL
jgi:hypothetical protein